MFQFGELGALGYLSELEPSRGGDGTSTNSCLLKWYHAIFILKQSNTIRVVKSRYYWYYKL